MKHVHCSLRSGKSDSDVRRGIDSWTDRADVITLTEATGFREVISSIDGWGSYQAPSSTRADNVAILFDKSVYRKVASGHRETGKVPYELRGVHNMVTDECAWAVLELKDKPGHRELWTVSHLPSSVQGADGFNNEDQRVRAWKSDATEWARVVEDLRNQFSGLDAVFVVADWNLDMNKAWCRAQVEDRFHGLKLSYKKDSSDRGTLDNRVIDATLSSVKPTKYAVVLGNTVASDHNPYLDGFFQAADDPEKDPPETPDPNNPDPSDVGTPTDASLPPTAPGVVIPVQRDTGPKIDHAECCGGRTL